MLIVGLICFQSLLGNRRGEEPIEWFVLCRRCLDRIAVGDAENKIGATRSSHVLEKYNTAVWVCGKNKFAFPGCFTTEVIGVKVTIRYPF